MPSHHTPPSSVSATFVKTVSFKMVCMATGLLSIEVPGATPKKPFSGLIARKSPYWSNLIDKVKSSYALALHVQVILSGQKKSWGHRKNSYNRLDYLNTLPGLLTPIASRKLRKIFILIYGDGHLTGNTLYSVVLNPRHGLKKFKTAQKDENGLNVPLPRPDTYGVPCMAIGHRLSDTIRIQLINDKRHEKMKLPIKISILKSQNKTNPSIFELSNWCYNLLFLFLNATTFITLALKAIFKC